MQDLEGKRRRARTGAEKEALLNLPATLAQLEVKIQQIACELGSQEFRELTGTSGIIFTLVIHWGQTPGVLTPKSNFTDNRATSLLAVQVAKAQLYCAKVGVLETYKQADRTKASFIFPR